MHLVQEWMYIKSVVAQSLYVGEVLGLVDLRECHLQEDQAQDALDRPVIEKTATSASGIAAPITCVFLTSTYQRLRLEWCYARGNGAATEWNQVVFSDESRFNLSSYDNRVLVRRPRGEHLNPAFYLQRHTSATAGVMVWGAIAWNTRSPLVLIHGTMTTQRYAHDILKTTCVATHATAPRSHFSTTQCSVSHGKGVTRLSPHCYYSSLACPIPRFVSDRAYLGSFGTASWASHEFERTRDKVTANMERNVSRYHTEL
ncbi:transposable element Tcb1 transposase [Trichonephila clavipes]|nr:transposable element Tcb1 transposase [Trichonephila clavipes]